MMVSLFLETRSRHVGEVVYLFKSVGISSFYYEWWLIHLSFGYCEEDRDTTRFSLEEKNTFYFNKKWILHFECDLGTHKVPIEKKNHGINKK